MSATEILAGFPSDTLQDARDEVLPVLVAADERMYRLIASAHEDEARAQNELRRLVTIGGVEKVIKIIGNDMKRRLHFGPMKGAFLVRGSKADSLAALAELPEALRQWKQLHDRAADVSNAHRRALENEEREFFEERARARQDGREPPSREQYQERRRKRQ